MKNRTMLLIAVLLLVSAMAFAAVPRLAANSEVLPAKGRLTKSYPAIQKSVSQLLPMGVLDTMIWVDGGNTNFGGWTDDYFAEYFVPSTDGILHSITFNMSDLPDVSGGGMNVWIYKANYSWPEISTVDIADGGNAWLGYYDTGTGPQAFGTEAEWHGGWIDSLDEAIPGKIYDPLGEKVWPMFGAGTVALEPTPDDKGFFTVNLIDLGSEYNFSMGDTFLVVIQFSGFPDGADGAEYRMGFLSGKGAIEPQPGLKFYNVTGNEGTNGRLGYGDYGWYIRSYIWDWRCNVEYTGDRGPVFVDYTEVLTTTETTPQTVEAIVTDDNPSGGDAGVASVDLIYSVDGGEEATVAMTNTSGDLWTGDIPGQVPGSVITYHLKATDVNGLETSTLSVTYQIFEVTQQTLFIYDDATLYGLEWYYWYGADPNDAFLYDEWYGGWGHVSADLLENYEVVVHIMGGGPLAQNYNPGPMYKAWLDGAAADGETRKLFLEGQDYGFISGYNDTTFVDGTFEKDYLGIETLGPQDINYDGTAASYQSPYRVDAVDGNELSGGYAAFCGDSVVLFYDPANELGYNNWIDNLTPASGAIVDFTDPNNSDAAVGIHNSGDNFKTVFWTIDHIALSFYDPADTASMYHWGLTDVGNLLGNALTWFGAPVNSVEVVDLPSKFALNQNYPNPFNPTTSISYSIPRDEFVRLSVYNMLGQKVRTLVSTRQMGNTYRVTWDGKDDNGYEVPSGVYFYNIQAGNFTSTKKMVLMK